MKYQQLFAKIAMGVFFLAVPLLSEASAQISGITFSRPLTGDAGVSEIRFEFDDADDVLVQIDQLLAPDGSGSPVNSLFQNNDDGFPGVPGQGLGILASGPIDTIGVVAVGDVLSAGMNFGGNALDVAAETGGPGGSFLLGFSTGTGSTDAVGYFNITWEAGDESDIVYGGGIISIDGAGPLEVGAVPEPGSLTLISALALAAFVRRRRS